MKKQLSGLVVLAVVGSFALACGGTPDVVVKQEPPKSTTTTTTASTTSTPAPSPANPAPASTTTTTTTTEKK
ncbi:MAG: hypothetical protein JST00_45025 [Deltaproteobacteria bacterium]|nr:hypothetical protein [Deltaproteobacteria bacterium]